MGSRAVRVPQSSWGALLPLRGKTVPGPWPLLGEDFLVSEIDASGLESPEKTSELLALDQDLAVHNGVGLSVDLGELTVNVVERPVRLRESLVDSLSQFPNALAKSGGPSLGVRRRDGLVREEAIGEYGGTLPNWQEPSSRARGPGSCKGLLPDLYSQRRQNTPTRNRTSLLGPWFQPIS